MAISKAQARRVKSAVLTGEKLTTSVLSSTNTTETLELSGPASVITVQSTGDLDFTLEVSVNGENFDYPTSVSANTMVNFNTNLVSAVKLTWTSGTGRVAILAVS